MGTREIFKNTNLSSTTAILPYPGIVVQESVYLFPFLASGVKQTPRRVLTKREADL